MDPLLFDSLSHPTISGDWFNRGIDASFESLSRNLTRAGFTRACAVGLAGHEGYEHAIFAHNCKKFSAMVPIAGVAPKSAPMIETELDEVAELNFRGIKIHPRLSGCGYDSPELAETLAAAERRRLPVFLCTYYHTNIATYPDSDPLFALVRVLKRTKDLRLILLHGGASDVMRWMNLARHSPNLLLDISYTMMRYAGSSVDDDLKWLFRNFSRHTCFGTDHPEWSHLEVKERFNTLARGSDPEAICRIGGLNLAQFLGVELG